MTHKFVYVGLYADIESHFAKCSEDYRLSKNELTFLLMDFRCIEGITELVDFDNQANEYFLRKSTWCELQKIIPPVSKSY